MADAIHQVRWRSPAGAALEHCAIRETDAGVTLEGVAIPADAATAFRYRLVADAGWTGLRSAHLTLIGGPTLALRHDGYGGWTDGEGKPRKDLAGILDLWLDISPVPALVLLRRLGGKPGKSIKLDAARADLTSLTVERVTLEVTCRIAGHYSVAQAGADAETIALGEDGILETWDARYVRVAEPAEPATTA